MKYKKFDQRIADCIELLNDAPLDKINTILDIGAGEGQISLWFSERGKEVIATGLEIDSYNLDKDELKEKNINILECNVEKMPFENDSFDAVVLSHVLEHCLDISVVLQEVKRVLKNDGFLFLFVPPYSNYIISGHATTGWNLGQLIYVLLLNGFNVKDGKFIHYGYNVCAFVQNSNIKLPPLRRDGGDINTLYKAGLFPEELCFYDITFDGFKGDIQSINWNKKSKLKRKQKIILAIFKLFHRSIRKKFVNYMKRLFDFLSLNTN
jgi:SAM-dependent methyltransferase